MNATYPCAVKAVFTMHEWALAEAIVLYLKEQGFVKAKKVLVYVGTLQSLDKDILVYAINELIKAEGLIIENIEVLEENPVLRCNTCYFEWEFDVKSFPDSIVETIHFIPEVLYAYYRCPHCGSRDFEILRGRGISRIEVIT